MSKIATVTSVPARRRAVTLVGPLAVRLVPLVGLMCALALTACADDAPQDTWEPEGPNAQKIHNLQWPVFAVAGIVGVLVFVAIVYVVLKFKDRGQPLPKQTHGKPVLEISLTIIPALILVGVAVPTVGTIMALAETDDTECSVNVYGQQWWWEIEYPQQDGCGGIGEEFVTSGQMVIPTGTNVLISGTSRDVIHSWWVPALNGKRDMVPGRVQTLRAEADHPGIYAGQCAEFCGLSHANMKMEIVALAPDDFETWKANQLDGYEPPAEGSVAAAGEAAYIQQCARCHTVNGLEDANGPVESDPNQFVYSGVAPNLTNLMTRNTFAGAMFDLLTERCRERVWEAPPEEFGERYLEGVTADCLNEVELREWLRNAPSKKPMYVEATRLEPTDGRTRGMPNLALNEEQIDQLIAYLLERK